MPITIRAPIRRLSQSEFGEISYEVMTHVFAIHNELGRFFNESIYKQELARRVAGVRLEEPIDVTFGSFHKLYFLDVLVGDGGVFEFKAVDALMGRHRAQLINYLLLSDLAHGKLVNVRNEAVEHEFVNTQMRRSTGTRTHVKDAHWDMTIPGAAMLRDYVLAMLHDLGLGLEISLYEEAIVHFLGGTAHVDSEIPVWSGGQVIGRQSVRLMAPRVALKVTCLDHSGDGFESHMRRQLTHLDLHAISWININLHEVTFTTLTQ